MKIKITLLIFGFFSVIIMPNITRGQNVPEEQYYSNAIEPPAQEAKFLVNSYNDDITLCYGILNYNLPIWNAKVGDLESRIGIAYKGGGVKVDQEASCVGMSWSLQAGGVITRIMNDRPDERPVSGYLSCYSTFEELGPTEKNEVFDKNLSPLLMQNDRIDLCPDLFQFGFSNYSGEFMINPNGEVVVLSGDPLKITYSFEEVSNQERHLSEFTIITPDGNTYLFNFAEKKYTRKGYGNVEMMTESRLNTAWYLTEIKSSNNIDYIEFNYSNEEDNNANFNIERDYHEFLLQGVTIDWEVYYGNENQMWPMPTPNTYFTEKKTDLVRLDSIACRKVYNNGDNPVVKTLSKALFFCSARTDYMSSSKVDSIEIYNIKAENGNAVLLKKFEFGYEEIDTDGGLTNRQLATSEQSFYNQYGLYDYYKKRLWLVLFREKTETEAFPAYKFNYVMPNLLPRKDSKQIDHWRYYNGSISNDLSNSSCPSYNNSSQVSRLSDFTKNRIGVLDFVILPTGGYKKFEFEQNRNDDLNFEKSGGLRIKRIYTNDGKNTQVKKYIYNSVTSEGEMFCHPNYIYLTNSGLGKITSSNGLNGASGVDLNRRTSFYPIVTELFGENGEYGRNEYHFSGTSKYSPVFPFAPVQELTPPSLKKLIQYKANNGVFEKIKEVNITTKYDGLENYVLGTKIGRKDTLDKLPSGEFDYANAYDKFSYETYFYGDFYKKSEKSETVSYFGSNSMNESSETYYAYPNIASKTFVIKADSTQILTIYKYPENFYLSEGHWVTKMHDENIISPIEIQTWKKKHDQDEFYIIDAELIEYGTVIENNQKSFKPVKKHRLEIDHPLSIGEFGYQPLEDMNLISSPLTITGSENFLNHFELYEENLYNEEGDLVGIQPKDNLPISIIWDRNKNKILGKSINANPLEVFIESFEDIDLEEWSFSSQSTKVIQEEITNNTVLRMQTGSSVAEYIIPAENVDWDKKYIVSARAKCSSTNGGSPGIKCSFGSSLPYVELIKTGEWETISLELDLSSSSQNDILISLQNDVNGGSSTSDVYFDNVIFQPAESELLTISYNDALNVKSFSDNNNRVVNYTYDNLNRLSAEYDNFNCITTAVEYNFGEQISSNDQCSDVWRFPLEIYLDYALLDNSVSLYTTLLNDCISTHPDEYDNDIASFFANSEAILHEYNDEDYSDINESYSLGEVSSTKHHDVNTSKFYKFEVMLEMVCGETISKEIPIDVVSYNPIDPCLNYNSEISVNIDNLTDCGDLFCNIDVSVSGIYGPFLAQVSTMRSEGSYVQHYYHEWPTMPVYYYVWVDNSIYREEELKYYIIENGQHSFDVRMSDYGETDYLIKVKVTNGCEITEISEMLVPKL